METQEANLSEAPDTVEPLPFPFNQQTFCRYEPIEKSIDEARVLIVDIFCAMKVTCRMSRAPIGGETS